MIAIIDYQMGNLRSVQKGFQKVGHDAVVTDDASVLAAASKVVLPGVGAFRDAMQALESRELVGPIREAIDSGKPFLGICLGLQLLFEVSFEGGEYRGLGIFPGKVVRFEVAPERKVPHMGWNQLLFPHEAPIFQGLPATPFCYFVHSYYVVPEDPGIIAAETEYGPRFCSAVWRDNVYATQFHPEKSQANGLRILKNFAELA